MHESRLKELLFSGGELHLQEVREACSLLFDDRIPVVAKADFLRELHQRRETPQEIATFAEVLLEKAAYPIPDLQRLNGPILEICGTGGDRAGLFNVTTTVMFVAAACGALVVKIGNRRATSFSGAADVLEALGVDLFVSPVKVPEILRKTGCVFLFAPAYYPIFRSVAAARQLLAEEGSRSLFNLLGPLLNPVRPPYQLAGLFEPSWIADYASILQRLGRKSAWVVCGKTGLQNAVVDEISTLGHTSICSLREGKKVTFQIHPAEFGFSVAKLEDLRGGHASENARILVEILSGLDCGPRRDIVVLNTAAALCVCGIAKNLSQGIQLASEAIASGEALHRLRMLIDGA